MNTEHKEKIITEMYLTEIFGNLRHDKFRLCETELTIHGGEEVVHLLGFSNKLLALYVVLRFNGF